MIVGGFIALRNEHMILLHLSILSISHRVALIVCFYKVPKVMQIAIIGRLMKDTTCTNCFAWRAQEMDDVIHVTSNHSSFAAWIVSAAPPSVNSVAWIVIRATLSTRYSHGMESVSFYLIYTG